MKPLIAPFKFVSQAFLQTFVMLDGVDGQGVHFRIDQSFAAMQKPMGNHDGTLEEVPSP